MTKREKQFVFVGVLFGLLVAGVVSGLSHHLLGQASGELDVVAAAQARKSEPDPPSDGATKGGETVSAVQLTEREQQQIGVQTVEVQRRNLRRTLSTVAQVEQPETGLTSVSARVSGRIDKLFVDFTGQPVRRGQEIALSFLQDIEVHVRFLVALPILIAAELIVHLRIRPVVRRFVERRIVLPQDLHAFTVRLIQR